MPANILLPAMFKSVLKEVFSLHMLTVVEPKAITRHRSTEFLQRHQMEKGI